MEEQQKRQLFLEAQQLFYTCVSDTTCVSYAPSEHDGDATSNELRPECFLILLEEALGRALEPENVADAVTPPVCVTGCFPGFIVVVTENKG